MGASAMQITDPDDIAPAITESTRRDGPTLLDVVVDDGFGNEGRQAPSAKGVRGRLSVQR